MLQKNIVINALTLGLFCLFGCAAALSQDVQKQVDVLSHQLSPQEFKLMIECLDKVAPRHPIREGIKATTTEMVHILLSLIIGFAATLLINKNNLITEWFYGEMTQQFGNPDIEQVFRVIRMHTRAAINDGRRDVVIFSLCFLVCSIVSYTLLKVASGIAKSANENELRRKLFIALVEKMCEQKRLHAILN